MEGLIAVDDWCILTTAPSRTVALAAALRHAGFDAWTPVEVQVRRRPRSRKQFEMAVPITPTFVFACFADRNRLAALAHSPALTYQVWDAEERRMVSVGVPRFTMFQPRDEYPRVADASLQPLRLIEERLRAVTERRRKREAEQGPLPRFKQGDIVRLSDGGYAGLDLIVTEANTSKMVKVIHHSWTLPLSISAWILNDVQVSRSDTADRIGMAS